VLRGTTTGGESLLVSGLTTSSLTYTDSSVSNGTTYYYEVKALNANGSSPQSNELSAEPTSSSMSPPSGYSTSDLIFEDNFPGSTLNSSKWVSGMGDSTGGVWNNGGNLPSPYSGGTQPGSPDAALFHPSQISIASSICTLTATPYSGTYASQGYSWLSGAITTLNLFTISTSYTEWWIQVNCQMPDVSAGMWPAIWVLGPGGAQEVDLFELGWQADQTSANYPPNTAVHSEVWVGSDPQTIAQSPSGVNMSSAYHIYGGHFVVGSGMTNYIDNTALVPPSGAGTNPITGAVVATEYSLMLTLQVAKSSTSGWHTVPGSSPPNYSWLIDEVQVYAK
jgi:hypothetical protein